MPTEAELGWLAGIVDGEGCIYSEWSNRSREIGGSLSIILQVEACSEAMILRCAYLLTELDVRFYLSPPKPRKSSRPSSQVLVKRRVEVLKILRILRPLLVVKQKEADIAIQYYERWGDQRLKNVDLAPKDEKIFVFTELRRLKTVA